jgi:hypothetical protein
LENGRPWSRANAKRDREPSAVNALEHSNIMILIIAASVQDPLTEPVLSKNIWMRGTPVELVAVASISPMQ